MIEILQGDAIEQLRTLPDESVHCCVTSPPYWGLRDYSTNGQIGLEKTPEEYVAKMVEVFREVRRVLRKDGTLWLNLGDSYWGDSPPRKKSSEAFSETWDTANTASNGGLRRTAARHGALKAKDLIGIPWRIAFALQADGWWLRSDIIWAKPNPMPESVTDRPTKAHEYLFLLTKSANYFYDAEAIKEPNAINPDWNYGSEEYRNEADRSKTDAFIQYKKGVKGWSGLTAAGPNGNGRNKRSVWTVPTAPYPEAHFATYPPDLIKPCILAGTSAKGCCAKCGSPWERIVDRGDVTSTGGNVGRSVNMVGNQRDFVLKAHEKKTIGWQPTCKHLHLLDKQFNAHTFPCTVLDTFAGSGTTGAVALELGRKAILIELNPKYIELIKRRTTTTPGFALC